MGFKLRSFRLGDLILIASILTVCLGCQKNANEEIIERYYTALNDSNFKAVKKSIASDFTIVEGEYVTRYDLESYHEHLKWDSIFNTSYKILSLEIDGETSTVSIESSSIRFKFLQNDPLRCSYKIVLSDGKITSITFLDCPSANWELWQAQVDSLVSWTKVNHPEIDGFIHDLSMQGAQNYLQAIEYFQNESR